MHCTPRRQPGRACLLMLLLAWCGAASATGHLRLVMMGPASMAPPAPDAAIGATPAYPLSSWITVRVKRGDTLSGLFNTIGLDAGQWQAVLDLGNAVNALRHLTPGDRFRVRKTPDGRLAALRFPVDTVKTLVVHRGTRGLVAKIARRHNTTRRISISGVVGASFSASLRQAGTPASVATQMAHIFAGREDLSQTMQRGDRFSIIYAAQFVNGEPTQVGPIIAASIDEGGHEIRAFRHVNADGQAEYYNSRGKPYAPSILRTPLQYTHVSSKFSLHRLNPVLGIVQPHYGVDLAAPRGTPVHAAANGVVAFDGWIKGYGRIVKINHAMGYQTRYAHLERFVSGLHKGEHVDQGQVIGYVGESGWATGPHLHFEIRKNGVAYPPLAMNLPSGKPLSGAVLTTFTSRIQPLIARLAGTGTTSYPLVASNTSFGRYQACANSATINSVLALAPERVKPSALSKIFCSLGS